MEPAVTRSYHPTNMPRRDPIAQGVLNRHHGKEVKDKFATKLPEMNPETAKHFSAASEATKRLTDEIVPKLVSRLNDLENGFKRSEELSIKRDTEINNKFDALMAAVSGQSQAKKPSKKATKKIGKDATDDFQGEEEDELPPPEK
jgi:hypothetical protein